MDELPQAVEQVVKQIMAYKPERIILFGSYARGEQDEYSDIDLILIKKTDTRFIQRQIEVLSHVSSEFRVDPIVYTPEEFLSMIESENPFIEQVLKDVKILYEDTTGNE